MGEPNQLPLLTASRLKDARACQRKHKYRYLDGYAPVEDASPLRFGTMFHTALEAWWRALRDEERLAAALGTIPPDADPYEQAIARALLIAYDARYQPLDLFVIAVEAEFRVPLVNPETGQASRTWELGGKLDVVARDNKHRVVLVEHKTSSEDLTHGSDYWKRLRLDGQQSTYFVGARAAGYRVEACIYDVVGKTKHRPLKATPEEDRKFTKDGRLYANQRTEDESPAEYENRIMTAIADDPNRYFARGEIVRLDAELDEAMADTWTLAKQLRESELAGRFPRNPDVCLSYGRTCPFFPVCTGEASLADSNLFQKLDSPHRELSQVA